MSIDCGPRAGPASAAGDEGRERAAGRIYQIRIKGHLDDGWCEWFEGLRLVREPGGTTLLSGPVADQPALHGLLIKIRDLGLPLLSVRALGPGRGDRNGAPNPGEPPGMARP